MEIIPAIMPKNYEDLKNKVALVRGVVPIVQLDLMDGAFTRHSTWPYEGGGLDASGDAHFLRIMNEEEGLPFWEDIDFEFDLMTLDAVVNFDLYLKLGPKRLVFHIEAVGDENEFKEFLEGIDLYVRDNTQIGVAINTTTPVEKILPLVPHIDFVQCMGIEHIGLQGEPFDERVLAHIRRLRKEFPELIISVDGAVNFATAPELIAAGANRLVIGSAIFKQTDIIGAIREFEDLNQ